ncbi:MAG: ATPase [Chromatiaceae bacterium]|nr:MAG: ATPase [Chromatiaceae bacterium]
MGERDHLHDAGAAADLPADAAVAGAPAAAVPTRMLFLGEDGLADGFRLIGFETHVNPDRETVEQVLRALRASRDKAFVVVDDRVMALEVPSLQQVRREGGRIVVIAVPPLAGPVRLPSDVADRLAAMFGTASLRR